MTRQTRPPIGDERFDRLIRQLLIERAEDVAAAALPADAMADRIATRLQPRSFGRTWVVLAAALLTALLIGGALVAGGQLRLPSLPPTPLLTDWTGPLRPDSASMPMVSMEENPSFEGPGWIDGRQDAEIALVDIDRVHAHGFHPLGWGFGLGGIPEPWSTFDPKQRLIEYGVVIDANSDGVADCLIGMSNDTPELGEFRVWVTNLATGLTVPQVGPPYGSPIDFGSPDAGGRLHSVSFYFHSDDGYPCELSDRTLRYYAWASQTESGRVTAWDYAPNAAWLEMPSKRELP